MARRQVDVCDFGTENALSGEPQNQCRRLADQKCAICTRDGCDEHLPAELHMGITLNQRSREKIGDLNAALREAKAKQEDMQARMRQGIPPMTTNPAGPAPVAPMPPIGASPHPTNPQAAPNASPPSSGYGVRVVICVQCWSMISMNTPGDLQPFLEPPTQQFQEQMLQNLKAYWAQKGLTK